jgi:hypothetical protein
LSRQALDVSNGNGIAIMADGAFLAVVLEKCHQHECDKLPGQMKNHQNRATGLFLSIKVAGGFFQAGRAKMWRRAKGKTCTKQLGFDIKCDTFLRLCCIGHL